MGREHRLRRERKRHNRWDRHSGNSFFDGGTADDQIDLDGNMGAGEVISFEPGDGSDTGWDPDEDFVYIGDSDIEDATLTEVSSHVWEVRLDDDGPGDVLTLDFTHYFSFGTVTEADVRSRFLDEDTYTPAAGPTPPTPACFTSGARVLTQGGWCAVESFGPRMHLLTHDAGYQPVTRVTRWQYGAIELAKRPALRPVHLAKDALGPGLPDRDTSFSRQHMLLAHLPQARLVRMAHLADLSALADAASNRFAAQDYLHISMAAHQLVLLNGIWAETRFDANRRPRQKRIYPLAKRKDLI